MKIIVIKLNKKLFILIIINVLLKIIVKIKIIQILLISIISIINVKLIKLYLINNKSKQVQLKTIAIPYKLKLNLLLMKK